MKYMLLVFWICLALMCCACNNEEAAPPVGEKAPQAPAVQYQIDYHDPGSIVAAYYQALFYNDLFMAYDFMYERDRWFMFPEDFNARYKLNVFAYPAYVAGLFSYETVSVQIDGERATVTGLITLPQTQYISALLADRLFDASLPPLNDRELRELVAHENWQYAQQTVRHVLLREEDRWYMFYDFETEETVAGLLRQAKNMQDSDEISALLDARDAYDQALALLPDSREAQAGLAAVVQRIAALEAERVYIEKNLELFDFVAKDYRQDHPDNQGTPGVTFKLRNNGDATLARVVVRVTFFNADGGMASRELVEPLRDFSADGQNSVLAPGAVWKFQEPAFYMTISPIPGWQEAWRDGDAQAEIIGIEFEKQK